MGVIVDLPQSAEKKPISGTFVVAEGGTIATDEELFNSPSDIG